jgi:O-antigen ligase/polysaccharide polymerase Wzy-like membrane protein
MPPSLRNPALPEPRGFGAWLLALLVLAGLFSIGQLGLMHPLSLLFMAVGAISGAWVLIRVAPVVFFWLVPISMAIYWKMWFQPYDLLIPALAVLMVLDRWSTLRWRELRLPAVEVRFLLFLACLLTTLLGPFSAERLIFIAKIYTMGFLAHEVARHAVRPYGRRSLVIGPIVFLLTTSMQLFHRFGQSGIPSFNAMSHRSDLTDLSWGLSNFVAAVMVICLPAVAYFLQTARNPIERIAGWSMIAASVGALFLTTSRGGLVLGAGFLASLAVRAQRAVIAIVMLVILLAAIALTPFGQQVITRFSDAQGMLSAVARFGIWGAAWNRFVHNLPFGVGHGQGLIQDDRLAAIDPHEFLLTLLSEGGVLALAAWLWLLQGVWSDGTRLARDPATRIAGRSLQATVVLGFLNALFEPTFPGSIYFVLFWWMAGIFRGTPERSPSAVPSIHDPAQDRVTGRNLLQHEGS